MPRGDKTGPSGFGPMTGRSAGYCTGNEMPGFQSTGSIPRQRMGSGRGRAAGGRNFGAGRRGFRNMYHMTGQPGWARNAGNAPLSDTQPGPEGVKESLTRQATILQEELNRINERIAGMSNDNNEENPSK